MYETFYGLREKPFSLVPDPKFIYLSKQHQGALDHMLYGIRQREGFMAIIGDVGTGKTTLCRSLLDRLDKSVQVALVLNPMLSDIDLLRTCLQDLRIRPARAAVGAGIGGSISAPDEEEAADHDFSWVNKLSKKELIDALNFYLLRQHEEKKTTVLIIDEAQNLPLEVMEQLRILSNLETEKEKLIHIIFVGQLELEKKLALPELKQLNQRISIRYRITPLNKEETRNYISHRLMVAGASSRISFANSSLAAIYEFAKGYPRLINLVCDRALLAGFNAQTDTVDARHVKQGIRSLMGTEENKYRKEMWLRRIPLAASIIFFLAGLLFFWKAAQSPVPAAGTATAPVSAVTAEENRALATVAEATPEASPAPAAPGNYHIQIYALTRQSSAEDNAQKLAREGFKAFWRQVESGGQTWFVVYSGPFTEPEAREQLNRLQDAGRKPILLPPAKTS